MTTIHLVTGGKGNVGKSSFACALATIGAAAGANPQLIDADEQKQTLSKLYGKIPVVPLSGDPALQGQPDVIWQLTEENKRDVIVDLAAQTDVHINQWMENRGILDIAKLRGTKIIKWWVADLDPDSLTDLLKLHKEYPSDQITHVLVKSLYRGHELLWAKTEAKGTKIDEAKNEGLKVIDFPRMFEGVIDRLRADKQTFRDVMLDDKHESTHMLNRATVLSWMRKFQAQINEVYEFTPVKVEAQKKDEKEEKEENTSPDAKQLDSDGKNNATKTKAKAKG